MKKTIKSIFERICQSDKVAVFGIGKRGIELINRIKEAHPDKKLALFDNNRIGESVNETIIEPPRLLEGNFLYVISAGNEMVRKLLYKQLLDLGVNDKYIEIWYQHFDYDYLSNLDESLYREEVEDMHRDVFGRSFNWGNPETYMGLICKEKITVKDPRRTQLADKYRAREWVAKKIGDSHLKKLYGVWNDGNEIDFKMLPDRFVIKTNHACGQNIIVTDKRSIDEDDIRNKLNEWLKINYAYWALEMHYKDIKPMIICEEYLDGLGVDSFDYDIFCFHGQPKYIQCLREPHTVRERAGIYNLRWEKQPFSVGYQQDNEPFPKPTKLDDMIDICKSLSEDFEHVRVDLCCMADGRVLFGEMTFATWAGSRVFIPDEYDYIFRSLI